MTKDDIIRMAREAGLHAPEGRTYILSPTIHPDDDLSEYLERFAALVASAAQAKECEACAKFIEHEYVRQFERPWRDDLSAAIRARGQR